MPKRLNNVLIIHGQGRQRSGSVSHLHDSQYMYDKAITLPEIKVEIKLTLHEDFHDFFQVFYPHNILLKYIVGRTKKNFKKKGYK